MKIPYFELTTKTQNSPFPPFKGVRGDFYIFPTRKVTL